MKKTIPCLSDGVKQIYLIEMHKKPSTQKTFEASALPIQAAPERVRHAALQHCATLLYHKTRFNNRVAIALQSSFQQRCQMSGRRSRWHQWWHHSSEPRAGEADDFFFKTCDFFSYYGKGRFKLLSVGRAYSCNENR